LPEPEAGPDACLAATDVIDSGHQAIVDKARLIANGKTDAEKARQLFVFVRDTVRYDFTPKLDSRDSWRASTTLQRGKGFCQQKAVLLTALCRAAKIPAGICFQHIRDHKLLDTRFSALLPNGIIAFHGLTAVWTNGAWVRLDPSLDAGLVRIRGYRLTDFNGTGEALLPPTDLNGQPHFDFLGQHGPFADFPRAISDLGVRIRPTWDALREVARKTGASM
jgi:transglutaminase-like putative cysteine protease